MGAELPLLSAVVARLADPEVHLAAYGGVIYPLALIIESPIIMLLAASTALSKDRASYLKLRSFMMAAGGALTALHVLVAFTPLYYPIVEGILNAPAEVVEPARIGLMIMTPWTWSIAYRRFNQGVLIRFGESRAIGLGSFIRLTADLSVLLAGLAIGTAPGAVVATSAVSAGVISEAVFVGIRVRPVLRHHLGVAPPVSPPLTYRAFCAFYVPLVLTSLLSLLAQPIGSAALGRMPQALASLAAWPVVSGLVFMIRGLGIALNEVVVSLLDEPGARAALRRFTTYLSLGATGILLVIVATPLSRLWFESVSALAPELAGLARMSLWIALPLPALAVIQSWHQGVILYGRRTRGLTESVIAYLLANALVLGAGVVWGAITGLYVAMAALLIGMLVQTAWLGRRARASRP